MEPEATPSHDPRRGACARIRPLWIVVLIGAALAARATQAQAAPPAGVHASAPPATGRIHCVLFAGSRMALVAGATVTIADGAAGQTDRRGSVFLPASAGAHALRIEIPMSAVPGRDAARSAQIVGSIPAVPVMPDDVTRVIATLGDDGKLAFELRVPPPPPPPPVAAAPTAAEGATVSGATGRVSGAVTAEGGAPIAGAKVFVQGQDAEARTGADGRFELDLPEGTYSLSIVHPDYDGQSLDGVVVAADATHEIPIVLAAAPAELEDYVVRGTRIRGSVATVIEERREAAAVTDAIGVEDIRRSPDGTASAATRRMVGATVVGGQFLFVRGLGGRYSNVRLNGVPLPSTDPDLPGFQLDLFPASLLSSLTIAKTFTPDIPADFAGGSMNIATRDFPPRFDLSASLQLGVDTEVTGRKAPAYDGGKTDFLGFDDGTRALPDEVPDKQVIKMQRDKGIPLDDVYAVGRAFPNRWELHRTAALPNLTLGLSLGDTTKISDHRLGYLVTFGYRYVPIRYDERITTVQPTVDAKTGKQTIEAKDRLQREVGGESAQLGGLGSISYELAKGHELTAVSVVTQTGDDKASSVTGVTKTEGMPIEQTQLTFVERQLLFNQLLGKHDLSSLLVDWQVNVARIERGQPDLRNLLYTGQPGQSPQWVNDSAERIYTDLGQTDFGGGANVTLPIDASDVKAGYLGRDSDQDFAARRFRYRRGPEITTDARSLPPEELFAPSNSGRLWQPNEETRWSDGYNARQQLHAAYGMTDLAVADWLRISGGARLEYFKQKIDVEPPIELQDTLKEEDKAKQHTQRTDTDVLPAGTVILGLRDDMSVRLAYGGTVARPLVREMAPFLNQDFIRRRTVTGNPALKRTYVDNFDARWEVFPSQTEVLAASLFYKRFQDPIEAVIQDTNGNLSYQNIDSARNYGFELEARVSLERIAGALRDVSLQGNFALIRSRISLAEGQRMSATSKQRPMAGQSPYVANLSLGYSPHDTRLSLNLFYNVYGSRIVEVGNNGNPDVYEQPFHSLDFTATYQLSEHWTLGLSATNLLLQKVVLDQAGFESITDKGTLFALRLGFVN
jgi:outer membrane receptor protein involved in Fe transport